MQTGDALLQLLSKLLRKRERAQQIYPTLLLARQTALAIKGLPVDPDRP
jgi:hypothetical protein